LVVIFASMLVVSIVIAHVGTQLGWF
jgi:hypothetical protein